jgi:sigma-B regulation protein RsbU (phosphoserine phosphatase)
MGTLVIPMLRSSAHPLSAGEGDLLLVAVSGPTAFEHPLRRDERGGVLTIGRRNTHALVLDRPEVSRDHAEFRCLDTAAGPRWALVDLGSRHQTRLNGQTLTPGEACPVRAGDIIEISPWTMRIMSRERINATMFSSLGPPGERQVRTVDDSLAGHSTLRTITVASEDLAKERLRLLLSCAEAIGAAVDEQSLARAVIDAATQGTGFPNAALLRPLMPDGTVSIIADTGDINAPGITAASEPSGQGAAPRLSRSLIQQASLGQPVQISSGMMVLPTAHSIVDLKIQEAMCVPLMLEGAAAGFLYLDTRSESPAAARRAKITEDAGAFAAGIARLAAMALMNLLRRDLATRFARMEGEITATASAQRLILPSSEVSIGPVRVVGECKPGRVVSGDFFDVMPLDDGRVAIALGDVAGKGVQASVLMTTTQGFLRGVLMRQGNLSQAVSDLNAYLYPRCDGGRFISLWLGAIDPQLGTLEYVNGGHGHAWLQRGDGEFTQLNHGGGPLVGVVDVLEYHAATVPMHAGDRVVLLSDGILEQPRGADRDDQFGLERVRSILSNAANNADQAIASLFDEVYRHAAGPELADDATVVLAGW